VCLCGGIGLRVLPAEVTGLPKRLLLRSAPEGTGAV
jgi:hypothetical protein